MEWMIVEPSLEEELALERTIREIQNCGDAKTLADLCASMARVHCYQSKLLKQAVGHIASFDEVMPL